MEISKLLSTHLKGEFIYCNIKGTLQFLLNIIYATRLAATQTPPQHSARIR